MPATSHRWLVSPSFDLGAFVVPGALALLLALGVGLQLEPREDDSLALWILGVVLVDVAHVWASLYRTYLDPAARQRHAQLLRWTPIVVFLLAFMAHAVSPRLFWGALAYVAVFHFIKQQEGFVILYLRAGGETGPRDRALAKLAVWASTAGPVIWWHTQLPRRFTWFLADDFIAGLPAVVGRVAVWAQVPILLVFLARRAQLAARGVGHPMVPILVALTALSWNLGIVWFNDGRVFTLTNVFIHGLPYLALVFITGGRELVTRRLPSSTTLAVTVAAFYGLLAVLAFAEETLWDRLVWHEHVSLFGHGQLELGELGLALCVALLSVPQATHYVLDRYIWRVGPQNPRLAEQLGLTKPT
ncbi:hypothetical protein [Enhygromyxa salina]|uniref:Uncharacterized protein n=1 Tax=Enhygromyxa salina TaxID=215803 RepID=A0A2S9YDP7_9BACT|nr:hypothetical protein [Enhygromyxa salina]PRQ03234.1 hypothetical protein ENSA7_53110 [Enhygromyxa salina]